MRLCEVIAKDLAKLGVQRGFGVPGEDIIEIIDAMPANGIVVTTARHENQSVAMADGYSRATGEVAVAYVTGGPGFSNAITALNTAGRRGSGVILITGHGQSGQKAIDSVAVCASVEVPCWRVSEGTTEEVAGALKSAFESARRGRPAVFDLPSRILNNFVEAGTLLGERVGPENDTVVLPDPEEIEAIVEHLCSPDVRAPLILAGVGAITPEAERSMLAIAEAIGALTSTTLRANGLFGADPFNLGIVGTYSTEVGSELLTPIDTVLVFGASLNRFTTYGGELLRRAQVIQIDSDKAVEAAPTTVRSRHFIYGDATATAEMFAERLAAAGNRFERLRTEGNRQRIAASDPARSLPAFDQTAGYVDPRSFAAALDKVLPAERAFVVDAGRHATYTIPYISVPGANYFSQTNEAGSIGLALGGAIGQAVGHPGAVVVLGTGDAGLLMAVGDLDTVRRLELPMVILVANDEALGAEVRFMELAGRQVTAALADTPDLVAIARGFGIDAVRVTNKVEAEEVLNRIAVEGVRGPLMIELPIPANIAAPSIDFAFQPLFHARRAEMPVK